MKRFRNCFETTMASPLPPIGCTMKVSTTPTFAKLAIIAAALSLPAPAIAQTPASSEQAPTAVTAQDKAERGRHHKGHHHKHHKMHHHGMQWQEGALLVPGYGALGKDRVQALKLNDDQQKLLAEAE